MSIIRTRHWVVALAALSLVTGGCSPAPKRSTSVPQESWPPPTLEVELLDRLGARWSTDYVQIFVDGWLIWEGSPDPSTVWLGAHALRGTGEQEIYVRVLATRRDDVGGDVRSSRETVDIEPGPRRIQIRLTRRPFDADGFEVSLDVASKKKSSEAEH